jgi:nucleoid-associated protein YgaU
MAAAQCPSLWRAEIRQRRRGVLPTKDVPLHGPPRILNMTRENKVALVVGFALVLFVGILISDYLSEAQTRRSADLAPPAARTAATAGRAGARLVDLQSRPRPRAQTATPPAGTGPPALPTGQPEAEAAQAQPPAAPPAGGPADGAPVQAPRFHDVRPGESLSEICHRYYGLVHLTDEFAEYNGIDDPDTVQAGHRLRVPPRTELAPGLQAVPPPEAPLAPEPAYGSYRIAPGDSLSGIARRFLQSADQWRQLYELNRDVIGDPDDIRVGTVIRVPAGAAR